MSVQNMMINTKNTIPTTSLEESFNAFFFEKYKFAELISLQAINESKEIIVNNKSAYKPSIRLAEIHRYLRLAILPSLKINKEVVFSYRNNKSSKDALKAHLTSHFFFITDFKDFFKNLNKLDIEKAFYENLPNIPIQDCNNYLTHLVNLTTIGNQLPVGFSTSPVLSNSILFHFDNELMLYCSEHNIKFTRYADDLIFSSKESDNFFGAIAKITELSNTLFAGRLKINEHKSKVLNRSSDKIKILGNVILQNSRITIDRQVKNKIESALHIYLNKPDYWETFLKDKFPKGIPQISGTLSHINAVDPVYIRKLKQKYGVLTVDLFLKRILEEEK